MTTFFADGVGTIGKDLWMWATVISNKAAMTALEAVGATTVQLQNVIRPGFGIQAETGRVEDRRLGSFVTYQSFGTTQRTLPDATFIDRPQDAAAAPAIKHIETITDGLSGYLVNRRGLGAAPENFVAWAVTQKYLLYPVTAGPQIPVAIPEDGGQFEYTQAFVITGAVVKGTVA